MHGKRRNATLVDGGSQRAQLRAKGVRGARLVHFAVRLAGYCNVGFAVRLKSRVSSLRSETLGEAKLRLDELESM